MSYYRVCPYCAAHLDPGEKCDCREDEKAASSVTSTESGKAEQTLKGPVSASHDTRF